jgi:hypothetical protein
LTNCFSSDLFFKHNNLVAIEKALLLVHYLNVKWLIQYMNDWFSIIGAGCELSADVIRALKDNGFVVIPGPVIGAELEQLAAAYDTAIDSANPDDVGIGSTTTRVHDFVNRGAEFDEIYLDKHVLEACFHIIGQPFKLSTMLARTVRPHSPAQALHVDFERDANGYPMIGFILMVDEFRNDNGATRFVPGSHKWSVIPDELINDCVTDFENQVVACGLAGSMIVYNGSVWHGHTANLSNNPRRSIQGAFIRREAQSGIDLPARMKTETLARIGPLAKYLLNL